MGIKKIKINFWKIMIILFFIIISFGSKECKAVWLSETPGEAYWFNNPSRWGERFSDFTATINGNRALCVNPERVSNSGEVDYVGDLGMDAAAIMYYSETNDRRALWEPGWRNGLEEWQKVTWDRLVAQMAFWHQVANFDYNSITLNEGWDGGQWYVDRMEQIKTSVFWLLTYARNIQSDFIIDNNMSVEINSSRANQTTLGSKILVGPYIVDAKNVNGNLSLTKVNGPATALITDVNGNVINSINNGGSIYVLFNSATDSQAEIEVKANTKTKLVCKRYNYRGGHYQDFATLETDIVPASRKFTAKPTPIESRKVYIKHIDEKTGNVISSMTTSARSVSKGSISNVERFSDFTEGYGYDIDAIMQVTSSGAVLRDSNGDEYKYQGGAKAVGRDENEAIRNYRSTTDTWGSGLSTVSTKPALNGDEDVTIIVFKYSATPPPPPSNPDVVVHTYYPNSPSNSSGDCETTYIPSGERLQPYIVTPKFLDVKLNHTLDVYPVCVKAAEYDEEGNETSPAVYEDRYGYYLSSYSGYKLNRTEYGNDTTNEFPNNKIIGNSKNDLFNGGSSYFDITLSGIDAELNSLLRSYSRIGYGSTSAGAARAALDSAMVSANIQFSKSNKTTRGNFPSTYVVPVEKYNGLRRASGKVTYVGIGSTGGTIGGVSTNANYVNVYTPIQLGAISINSGTIVNHTTTNTTANIIQKNAEFTLQIGAAGGAPIYNGINSAKYVDHYYAIFDMDITTTQPTEIRDYSSHSTSNIGTGQVIKKGTPVRVNKNNNATATASFRAKASNNNTELGDIVDQLENSVTVIGATYNMPDNVLEDYILQNKITYINQNSLHNWPGYNTSVCNSGTRTATHGTFGAGMGTYGRMNLDAYYFAKDTIITNNISRIYDFKLTDCSDVDFKDVFRVPSTNKETNKTVNVLTDNVYYSGINQLRIYQGSYNDLSNRTDLKSKNGLITKTLPLGPYKHIAGNYIKAPKMGYRISFDLKTSGYYNPAKSDTKYIQITPSYYYISKDAKTYYNNINLYYKDSTGKYRNFNGSNYTITYRPNDGYRSLYNKNIAGNLSTMSTKLLPLNVSKTFNLTKTMMSYSDNNFIQAWYGEFKLPNSTIALGGPNNSLNNSLTNGYVGVRFNMTVVTTNNTKTISVNYNTSDKTSGLPNTTQWDYEGYLGIDYGKAINASNNAAIKLEKDNWNISNQTEYDKVRGTIVFFDLDNRAANDFE